MEKLNLLIINTKKDIKVFKTYFEEELKRKEEGLNNFHKEKMKNYKKSKSFVKRLFKTLKIRGYNAH